MRVLPYGDDAVLVETDRPLALAATLRRRLPPGVEDVVPAAATVLISGTPAALRQLRGLLPSLLTPPGAALGPEHAAEAEAVTVPVTVPVTVTVRYDGPDLATTAELLGLAVDGLVRAHTAGRYTSAFCGFAPGFAYLTGLDPALHAARLPEPRTRVPAGAVGIAGEFTGVYPRSSPGGWRLLGHTDAVLWDADREPPALLAPGTPVRFEAI